METKEAFALISRAAHQGVEALMGPVDQLDGILADDIMEQISSALGILLKIEQVAACQLDEPNQEAT